MNHAVELLKKVMEYRDGVGKFNFSALSSYDKENAVFDAWQNLEQEIKVFLKEQEE